MHTHFQSRMASCDRGEESVLSTTMETSQQVFVDANAPTIRKKIKKPSKQEPYESRVVWRDLTEAIANNDSEAAGEAKHTVEERQRAEARERQHSGMEWKQRFFEPDDDHHNHSWHYKSTLDTRLGK